MLEPATTPSLRGLASAHAAGLIDRQTYIRQRRRLIDGIVSGEIEIVPWEPPSAAEFDRTDSDITVELEQLTTQTNTAARSRTAWRVMFIIISAMLALTMWLLIAANDVSAEALPDASTDPSVNLGGIRRH